MSTKRRTFDKEFKLIIIDLINSGQKVSKVSVDYGLNDAMIRRWKKEFSNPDRPSFTGKGVVALSPEEKEIRELNRELQDAQMERDILKKALGIFSKTDRNSTPI